MQTFNQRRHYSAVLLEHLVLAQYAKKENRDFFRRALGNPTPELQREKSYDDFSMQTEKPHPIKGGISWWEPPEHSLFTQFFKMSGLHGLKYLVEPKRHISERIFWGIIFLVGVGASAFLINDVWRRYNLNPVIVSFLPDEIETKNIPFPAVTICNINKFPKSKLKEAIENSKRLDTWDPEVDDANTALTYIKNICGAQTTFAQSFGYAFKRANIDNDTNEGIDLNDSDSDSDSEDLTLDDNGEEEKNYDFNEFLIKKTIPCEEQIRLCSFRQEQLNCGKIFKPIVTAHGKCCSFNLMPIDLLLYKSYDIEDFEGSNGKTQYPKDTQEDKDMWSKWRYEEGFILDPEIERPRSQKRAGALYGLNILLDANTDEYFCPSADSEGFRLQIHNSLEFPHVEDYGLMIELGKELYLEIEPELTVADEKIKQFDVTKRLCYFSHEKHLEFFKPYSFANCFDECISKAVFNKCGCVQYFMPRNETTPICSPDGKKNESKCVKNTKESILNNLQSHDCKNCDSLCSDITYKYTLSESSIQKSGAIWTDIDHTNSNFQIPSWAHNNVSILHIYFGSTSTVPKYRKELYGVVDLIANTGGLLGLSLGFSILSAIEFIYFFTCRPFCMRRRQRMMEEQRNENLEHNSDNYMEDNYFYSGIHPLHPPYKHQNSIHVDEKKSDLTSVYIN